MLLKVACIGLSAEWGVLVTEHTGKDTRGSVLHLLKVAENFRVAGRLILQPCIAVIAHAAPFHLALGHLLGCDWRPQTSCTKPCSYEELPIRSCLESHWTSV